MKYWPELGFGDYYRQRQRIVLVDVKTCNDTSRTTSLIRSVAFLAK